MRTQPQEVIAKLEADNSRLKKEAIGLDAMKEGLDEFFEGLKMCLDKLYTFGVKQVPTKDDVVSAQGCKWEVFKELAEKLYNRELTGHAARDAIKLVMSSATAEQWNGFYRRILIKDLRCGVSEKTVSFVGTCFTPNVYKGSKHILTPSKNSSSPSFIASSRIASLERRELSASNFSIIACGWVLILCLFYKILYL